MTSLIDRYVRAVARSLPRERRAAESDRLATLIADEVARRGGDDDAVRSTLTEMGDPRKVAQEIAPQRHRIVGADQYPSYIRVLRDSLLLVVPIVVVLGALVEASLAGSDTGSVVVAGVVAAGCAVVAVVVVVTLGFVLVERLVPARPWTLDDLPDDTEERRIAFADVVLEAVAVLVGFGVVVWQQVWPPITTPDGEAVPLLQPELWDLWLWVFFGLCAASVVLLALAYRRGRWTMPLAVANLVVGVCILVLVVWLAVEDRLLNPPAQDAIAARLDVEALAGVPTLVVLVFGVVALVVDAAGPLRSARR